MKTKKIETPERSIGLTPSALVLLSFLIIPAIASLSSWIFNVIQALFR
jgi:ABC-type phosphate transport system permease subunit